MAFPFFVVFCRMIFIDKCRKMLYGVGEIEENNGNKQAIKRLFC